MRSAACIAFLTLSVAGILPAARAQPAPSRGVFTAQFDNDVFLSTDQNYTSGARFSYVTPVAPNHPLRPIARTLPLIEGEPRISYTLAQMLFTPRDVSQTQPILTDQPYAGYLYLGLGFESERRLEAGRSILDSVQLQVGIVGPHAYGEETQKAAHKLFGSEEPLGWDNQLNDELAINLFYSRVWGEWLGTQIGSPDSDLRMDLSPHLGAALGNVYTYAAAGATFRFGQNLPAQIGPASIHPGPPGTDYYKPASELRWYLFIEIQGRAVARNIFLDGNTFTDSHSVDKNALVGELRSGIAVQLGRFRLTYARTNRSEEFTGQPSNRFGSISLSAAF